MNLSKMWTCADYTQRQELQTTFFPSSISYNRKNDTCRTLDVNDFLARQANQIEGSGLTEQKMGVLQVELYPNPANNFVTLVG